MLSDTARKLLLITHHYSKHYGYMPSMSELERLSGRLPDPIKVALQELVEEHYLEWDPNMPTETAIIIEGWERPDPRFKTRETVQEVQTGIKSSSLDYWTNH